MQGQYRFKHRETRMSKSLKIIIENKVLNERIYGRGAKGNPVAVIQQALIDKGYDLPNHKVDGKYGPETAAAVKKFQEDEEIKVDGIVGPQTLAAMGLEQEDLDKEEHPVDDFQITGGFGDAKVGKVQGEEARFYSDMTKIGGTRAWRNNNPGNLRLVTAWKWYGAIGRERSGRGGFAIFPTEEAGFAALEKYIEIHGAKKNKSIADFTNMYAPRQDSNDPKSYAAQVADAIGETVDVSIANIKHKIPKMAKAMSKVEGWKPGKISDPIPA